MSGYEGLRPEQDDVGAPLDFGGDDAFASLVAELERVRGERDELHAERDDLRTELDATRIERDDYRQQADHDPALPNILNKRAWIKQSVGYIATGRPVGVFMIDIDNFGLTNKQLGVLAGDRMLEDISARLVRRRRDIIGRWGGDEFVVTSFLDDEDPDAVDTDHRSLDPHQAMRRRRLHLVTASNEFVQVQNAKGWAAWLGVSIGGAATLDINPAGDPADKLLALVGSSDIDMRHHKVNHVPEITSEKDVALTSISRILASADIPPEMLLKYLKAQEQRGQKPDQQAQPLRSAA